MSYINGNQSGLSTLKVCVNEIDSAQYKDEISWKDIEKDYLENFIFQFNYILCMISRNEDGFVLALSFDFLLGMLIGVDKRADF